jgi:hypothetical protein
MDRRSSWHARWLWSLVTMAAVTFGASGVGGSTNWHDATAKSLAPAETAAQTAPHVMPAAAPPSCPVKRPNGSTPTGEPPGPLQHGNDGLWTEL